MKLVLPMYNVHLNFSLYNLGKNCTLYMANMTHNGNREEVFLSILE